MKWRTGPRRSPRKYRASLATSCKSPNAGTRTGPNWTSGFVPSSGPVTKRSDQLALRLAQRIREVESEVRLNSAQIEKLKLAGRGDIKHLLDLVDHATRLGNDPLFSTDQMRDAMAAIYALGTPARERVFESHSLFSKTLESMLDPGQVAERHAAVVKDNQLRHQAAVDAAITILRDSLSRPKNSAAVWPFCLRQRPGRRAVRPCTRHLSGALPGFADPRAQAQADLRRGPVGHPRSINGRLRSRPSGQEISGRTWICL